MFIDKTLIVGFSVAALAIILSVGAYLAVVAFLSVDQETRMVGLAASPRSVVFTRIGESAALSARAWNSDRSFSELDANDVFYTSTNPSVVSVDTFGNATAAGAGSADVIIEYESFRERVPAIVYGDMNMPPPVNPDLIGPIPELDPETEVALNRVIIELIDGYGVGDAQALAATFDGRVVFSFRTFRGHIIEFNPFTHQLTDIAAELEDNGIVEAVYADVIIEASHHPQPIYDTFAGGQNVNVPYREAGFALVWRMLERVQDLDPVNIAVLDSGLPVPGSGNFAFTDLDLSTEFDWDKITLTSHATALPNTPADYRHGTAVTSVIAAVNSGGENPNDDLSGIVSSVPGLDYHLHFFTVGIAGTVEMSSSALTAAFEHIENIQNDIDVVNLSYNELFGPLIPFTSIPSLRSKFSYDHKKRLDLASDMSGVTFVPGAGNDATNASLSTPADWSEPERMMNNAITVGGTNSSHDGRWHNDILGQGSNFGSPITIAAPAEGVAIVDVTDPSGYGVDNGTSFAAPMVTGTVALLKAVWPSLTPSQISDILVESADYKDVCVSSASLSGCPASDIETWPFLRADKAMDMLLSNILAADIGGVTANSQGSYVIMEADVENRGSRSWPLYATAWARSPSGDERELEPVEIVVPPGDTHPFRWGFSATEPGAWNIRIEVSRDHETGYPSQPLAVWDWGSTVVEVEAQPSLSAPSAPDTGTAPPPSTPGGALQADANVLLLADTSGSMEGEKIEALKQSVLDFVGRVDDPGEFVGLFDFDSGFRSSIPMGPMGTDLSVWEDAVATLDGDGGTAFYDAVVSAVSVLESDGAPNRTNIIIALTDGMDQDSAQSLSDAIAALQQSSAPILMFAIAYGEPGDYDLPALESLAEATGGIALPATPDDLERLYALLSTIF